MKAPLKPWVSARDAGEPESSALVTLLVDTEERIARPSAPPTCWVVLRSPEASPDSLAGTPLVAEIVIGTNFERRQHLIEHAPVLRRHTHSGFEFVRPRAHV